MSKIKPGTINDVYLFSINKKHELVCRIGHIIVNTVSSTAMFQQDDGYSSPIYCSREPGVLYHGNIWYESTKFNKTKLSDEDKFNLMKEDAKEKFLIRTSSDIEKARLKLDYFKSLYKDINKF